MKIIQLLNGEFSAENAPQAQLEDGRFCIPQHYLNYQHTLASVEELILKLDYCDKYPIFVSQDKQGIYLQVGIIGVDNYLGNNYSRNNNLGSGYKNNCDAGSHFVTGAVADKVDGEAADITVATVKDKGIKIVYGRKWRVEPQLPSAEIVQTAFLAIKTAREHEIRELFRLTAFDKVTTPFNNHHDVTMLINSQIQLKKEEQQKSWSQLQRELDNIRYDQASFHLLNIENKHEKYWLLELEVLIEPSTKLPELKQAQLIVLVLNKLTFNEVCYQLMAELVRLSDRHVDENFTFLQVARFSQQNDIKAIASISANTRELHKSLEESDFEKQWRNENYQVDLTRVPQLNASVFSEHIKGLLNSFGGIEGILPDYS